MALSHLLNSMAMLLVMILPGFIFKRKNMVTEEHVKSLSGILVNLIVPCLIINSFQLEYTKELSMQVLKVGVLWGIMICFCAFFLFVVSKKMNFSKIEKGILAAALMIPNTGFVGIPVIEAFFGAEGLFYISICEIVSDMFAFSLVYSLVNRSAGVGGKMPLKEFLSPPMVAIFVAYALFIFNIKLPSFLGGAIENIGSASTAIAMFILGAQMEKLNIRDFLGKKKLYMGVLLRLVVMPLIAALIMRFLLKDTSLMATVFVLAWAMPAGIFSVIFSEKLGTDPSFATENVMLSNVLCLITIPIWTMIV